MQKASHKMSLSEVSIVDNFSILNCSLLEFRPACVISTRQYPLEITQHQMKCHNYKICSY